MNGNRNEGKPREECGVFAVYGHEEAARVAFFGLFALQHRGQESAGIASADGCQVWEHKGMGLASEVFREDILAKLPGTPGDRPCPLFHDGLVGPLQRPALFGPPCRRVLRPGPQRKPHQRPRTAGGARRAGIDLPVHDGQRGDRPPDGPPSEGGAGRGPDQGPRPGAGRLQHRHADPEPRHRRPRPPGFPPPVPRPVQRRLGRGLGDLRLRPRRGEIPPGRPARRDHHHRRGGAPQPDALPGGEARPTASSS